MTDDNLSPLPTRTRPAQTRLDREGVSWGDYVRSVTFEDALAPAPDEAPVHVVRRVLFDDVLAPCRIHRDGITVDLSGHDGTVVTLWVHRDDVQVGTVKPYTPWLIGGRRVVTPVGKGWDWVPVESEEESLSGLHEYIACAFQVAEVHVR